MIPDKYKKYNPTYLTKGKRSYVYIFSKGKKKYILKTKRPDSTATHRMENEATFLKKLNKYNIGPKYIDSGEDYIVWEYVKGILLPEFLDTTKKPLPVLKDILNQCYILDKLKINKEEMHRPIKHFFVNKNKVTIIDFERCHHTEKPQNVTQFLQFVQRKYSLNLKKESQEYKLNINKKNFDKIISQLSF